MSNENNIPMRMAGGAYIIGESIFGTSARPKRKLLWEPDELNNGHLLIWGGSGSGKTVFLRDVIAYLQDAKKHVHVLDLHGDLHVDGGNDMRFGSWDSQYGVNPFEFLREYNAGPEQQCHEIVEMFRKTYMRTMGPLQEAVLRQLILDTYKLKGILPRDMDSWGDPSELPVMEDMLDLINHILKQDKQISEEERIGTEVMKMGKRIGDLSKEYRGCMEERDGLIDQGASQSTLHEKEEQLTKLEQRIQKARIDLQEKIEQYIEHHFVLGKPPVANEDVLAIDYEFYLERSAKEVVKKLRTYVGGLVQQGVFSTTPPPVKAGLNRYDLSLMNEKAQVFFCDVLVGKVFRALRNRGEYMRLESRPRGERLDTYIVIDEAQKIMPDKQSVRDLPNLLMNRIMSEARKFGLGLIVVTQSPSNFSSIMLANAAQKIGFNTNANDIPAAKRLLGIRHDHLFEHARRKGVAIVSDKQGYLSVQTRVPWLIGEAPNPLEQASGPPIGSASTGEHLTVPPNAEESAFDGRPALKVIQGSESCVEDQVRESAPRPAVTPRI